MPRKYADTHKVCGLLIVKHLIPKPWALMCCCNSFDSSGKPLDLAAEKSALHGAKTASVRSNTDVGQSQTAFQLLNGAEVRALFSPVWILPQSAGNMFLYGAAYMQWSWCWNRKGASSKSWHKSGNMSYEISSDLLRRSNFSYLGLASVIESMKEYLSSLVASSIFLSFFFFFLFGSENSS